MAGDDVEIVGHISIDDNGNLVLTKLKESLKELPGHGNRAAGGIKSLSDATEHLGRIADFAFGTLLAGGIQKVIGLFTGAVGGAINFNANLEQSTLQFETLLGSTDAAQKHIKDLYAFAAKTPFESEPIIKASKSLLTFGGTALDTMDTLTMLGNSAAITGNGIEDISFWTGRAYSAIQGGKPFGEAAMRLQEMGIMTPKTRDELEKLQKSGASADKVWQVFTQDFKRFDGAMDKQGRTFSALTSTISDNVNMALGGAFRPFFDVLTKGLGVVADFVQSADFTAWADSVATSLKPIADLVGNVITAFAQGGLEAALETFKDGLLNLLPPEVSATINEALAFITTHLEELKGALTAIGIAAGAFVVFSTIAGLLNPVTLIIIGITALIGALGAAWAGNWGGIRDTLTAVWTGTILPALTEIQAWLGVNIPIVITTLTTFWNTTLLPALINFGVFVTTTVIPAIQAIANWISTALIPAIMTVAGWIGTNLIPAIQNLATWLAVNLAGAVVAIAAFWNTTLLPAFTAVGNFIAAYIIPYFTSLTNLIGVIVVAAVNILVGLWQNVLLPALQAVGGYLSKTLSPVINDIANFLNKTFNPAIQEVAKFVGGVLAGAFKTLGDIINTVKGYFDSLAQGIASLKLPSWLTPHSPTDLEIGLWGIANALAAVNGGAGAFSATTGRAGAGAGASYQTDNSRALNFYFQGTPDRRPQWLTDSDIDRLGNIVAAV